MFPVLTIGCSSSSSQLFNLELPSSIGVTNEVIVPALQSDQTIEPPDPHSSFTRLLLHPHENEQPFTRTQSGINIPGEITQVTVRAHDIINGFGWKEVDVILTAESGPDFEVQR